MAYRTSKQALPKDLDAGTVTAELQTANVACFQIKIQLSGFSAYPDGSPSQLIRISVVLPYKFFKTEFASFTIFLITNL